jgi:gamma-glutamyltranspeptidase
MERDDRHCIVNKYILFIVPGKRPLSSITPVIIEDNNELDLVIGGSGGSQILTATLNVSQYIIYLWCS